MLQNSICTLFTATKPPIEDDIEDVTWIKKIHHRARIGSVFTISLSKMDFHDICTLQTPNGTVKKLNHLVMKGVHVHGGTIIVACRVDIGPINDSLLGTWTLCGQYTEDHIVHKRCQPVTIEYS